MGYIIEGKLIRKIADKIWDSFPSEQNIDVEDWCQRELKQHLPTLSDLEIHDILDDVVRKVESCLKKNITISQEKSIPPRYEFSDVIPHLLYRSKEIPPFDPEKIKSAIKNMHWRQFEYLCKHLLEINGAERAEVTRGSKDRGIDFYGVFSMDKCATGVLLKGLQIQVIGTARQRKIKIDEDQMGAIAQKFENFQSNRNSASGILPEWFIEMRCPIVCMVVTATQFTRGAINLAAQKGIIRRDNDQIIEDIIRSPKSHEWFTIDEKGNQIFDEQLFAKSFVSE